MDSLLVDESKPVTVPIAGDLVPEASGHFVYSPSNLAPTRRGFNVLQNSNEQVDTGNQCKFSWWLAVEKDKNHTKDVNDVFYFFI